MAPEDTLPKQTALAQTGNLPVANTEHGDHLCRVTLFARKQMNHSHRCEATRTTKQRTEYVTVSVNSHLGSRNA